ncbi:2-phosphoxylose phosphatase 1 [Drosophila guanche]|uniref:2-phosphoxylose phosphatase 1 n=1 Tax=Drosophila guanche TaxID=7266 RepID=A0A3B0K710_DROGU|nr:2-phosphoxylose phosphatase 1 [Drosophila guanche]SPP79288.1 blast:Acid phosphatase-like protein 2 [Drosophila guanche]
MLLLKELMRLATQHRTFYCYVLLSIWIFLLIAGMYRYMGSMESSSGAGAGFGPSSGTISSLGDNSASSYAQRFAKYRERCAPLAQLQRLDDGGILEGWKLQGVLLVIRHGDRGPMSHVRTTGINCGVAGGTDNLVNRYRSFLHNSSSSASGSNHMYWNKVGPFHGFPLLPATERGCPLGQLTYKGISQLLHVGDIMHQVYAHPLGLLLKPPLSRGGTETTPHTLLNSDEVVVYTTRYRRTFQSALAMLFTLLPADKWLGLNVRESHSMAFCFGECTCAQSALLRKRLQAMGDVQLLRQTDVLEAMQWIGGTLLQHTPNGITNPFEVVDAMLTVLCHEAALPCRHKKRSPTARPARKNPNQELVDVINIDQDETATNLQPEANNGIVEPESNEADNGNPSSPQGEADHQEGCVEATHVDTLMSFADDLSKRSADHAYYKLSGLLRSYGMIRHIVSYMLKMISGDRTKFVLYSGHDCTMQYLTAALGIANSQGQTIAYASRLAFEVYRSEAHTDYYFRVVYNGRDVTQQIDFCEGGKSLRVTRDSRGNKADLCPIENIIRFLHEDYFAPLNATNFKEACGTTNPPKANEF